MTKDKVLLSKIDANIHVIRAEPQEDIGEQASGTDVLPSDCSGCPLYDAKEGESNTRPIELSSEDMLYLRYLLWKEVHDNGYIPQIRQVFSRLFPE